VLLLNESKNTDITSSADGQTCGVRYSAFEIDDEVVEWQYKRKYGVFVKSGDVEGDVTIEALRAASM
jgi:hypothetical protein